MQSGPSYFEPGGYNWIGEVPPRFLDPIVIWISIEFRASFSACATLLLFVLDTQNLFSAGAKLWSNPTTGLSSSAMEGDRDAFLVPRCAGTYKGSLTGVW